MRTIGILTTSLGVMIAALIWRGFVFSKLWAWFIVPVFHAPSLTVGTAIGVAAVTGFLTAKVEVAAKEKQTLEAFYQSLGAALAHPAFCLLFGWIIKQWI